MSTLRVATIETENELTDLTLKTGNTSGPSITIYAGNGEVAFDATSNMSFTATAIDYSGVVTYSSNTTFSGNNIFSGVSTFSNATVNGDITYPGTVTYTGNADFSSANVVGEFGITTGKAIAMAIVFGG